MVGRRDVHDVAALRPRHVARDAAIIPAPRQAHGVGQRATLAVVARQALLAEVVRLLGRRGDLMRVVARDAAEPPPALAVATAGPHLLDVPHRLAPLVRATEDREEVGRGQTGAIVERLPTRSVNAMVAQEVALLADGLAEAGLQVPRVDDRRVPLIDQLLAAHMQLARAVAAFAADRVAPEEGLLVSIDGLRHRLDMVGMAEQAGRLDRPIEVEVVPLVAGGEVPPRFWLYHDMGDSNSRPSCSTRYEIPQFPDPTAYFTSASTCARTCPRRSCRVSRWISRPPLRSIVNSEEPASNAFEPTGRSPPTAGAREIGAIDRPIG